MKNTLNGLEGLQKYDVLNEEELFDTDGGTVKPKWHVIGGFWAFMYGAGHATGQFFGNAWNLLTN